MSMQKNISGKDILFFIVHAVKPFRFTIFIMCAVALIWAIDLSLRPYVLKIIIDRISEKTTQSIFSYVGIPALIYFLSSFFVTTMFRFYEYFVEIKMIPDLRQQIAQHSFSALLEKSYSYYQNNFSGSLTNKVNDLINSVPEIIQIVIDRFVSHGLALFIAIFTLWQINVRFACAVLIWASFCVIGAILLTPYLSRLSDAWSECGSRFTGKVVDALSNILSIRLFARKKDEESLLAITTNETTRAERKLQWGYFSIWITYGYSFVLVQAFCLFFLLKGRQDGWITTGDFAVVLAINFEIVGFLWEVTRNFSQFSKLLGKITQALRQISMSPEIKNKPDAQSLIVHRGKIVFEQVGFHYKGTDPLFKNKSVTIAAGEKVGLVGYSGSGKTTFVHLILRLFEASEGKILIDEQAICDVTQESLHRAIGMIPQDPTLFHRTLLENIRYGRIEATDEEVMEAAKRAHAHEFIEELPEQYGALVGERGVKLSGGQRQRIAIARAILKNAPILILDEATSQLDSLTESHIQESLWELMKNKTTLVVAHRLSTLLQMDRILVFEKGQIIEDGTHVALLEKNGRYKALWDAQVGGFLPEHV